MMSLNYLMVLILNQTFNIIFCASKKHKKLTTNPAIHIYYNRINNKFVFKITDGYKLELQMPKTMTLFGSTKKIIDKIKNGENMLRLEVVEVDLVQCNLVDNQYQQKPEVLYTFTPNTSYRYLLNVEPNSLVFLKLIILRLMI